MKKNCWEVKQCERYPGGQKVDEFGICPAAIEKRIHGVNGGINGGRICWAIEETLCGNNVQGSITEKLKDCLQCDFYGIVKKEEGVFFVTSNTSEEALE